MIWEMGFSREASNYALDSHPYNEEVLIAIEELAFVPTGLPQDGWFELEPEIYLWEVAAHQVIYQRITTGKPRLWIAIIKPL